MLQTPAVKPPDETDALASPRSSDRRLKSNGAAEQIMKCPRCDSMNTKFCYYNNYSLTQPRHFCKNCRRYWTKGGALRNVPIGGGCRKNKRSKQRSVDPSSLGSLDETASNMLASISSGHCSPLLPGFVVPSSSSFVELANDSHRFGLTFARIQESIRLGEQSGAVPSNPDVYGLGAPPGLVNSSCSQSSPVGSLPAFEAGLLNLGYPSCSVKSEPGLLYHGSHFSSLFETPSQMATATTAAHPAPDDHLSRYSVPGESFNGCGVEAQVRLQPQKLAMHLGHEEQSKDRGQLQPAFEDEINENFRRMKGKSFLQCLGDGRSLSDWQGVQESLFETSGESNLWSNPGWPEMHVFSGSTAGATL